jgi:hypothetical protein
MCDLYGVPRKGKARPVDAFAHYLMGAATRAGTRADHRRGPASSDGNGGLPILKQISSFSATRSPSQSFRGGGASPQPRSTPRSRAAFTTSTLDASRERSQTRQFRLQVAGWAARSSRRPSRCCTWRRGIPRRVDPGLQHDAGRLRDGAFFISGERAGRSASARRTPAATCRRVPARRGGEEPRPPPPPALAQGLRPDGPGQRA